jgi:hypothetical protein
LNRLMNITTLGSCLTGGWLLRLFLRLLLCLLLSPVGCTTHQGTGRAERMPSQELIDSTQWVYRDSISCQKSQESFGSDEKVKLSALSGFLVGPTSAKAFPDLESPILRPFYSDGCSRSPDKFSLDSKDSRLTNCCIRHDISYWLGGTEAEKEVADQELDGCISGHGHKKTGKIYGFFPGKFGGPLSSESFRWGYGWNYRRPFGKLTDDEKKQVDVLYGVSYSGVKQYFFANLKSLTNVCDTIDPVFSGFSSEEKKAYEILNNISSKNDRIEWAKWGYWNLSKREFEVKLEGCEDPLIITFYKDSKLSPTVKGLCYKSIF